MDKSPNHDKFAAKLEDVRLKLLGDVSAADLERLQTHADMLERAMGNDLDFHHHDTNEHHDHVTLTDRSALASNPVARAGGAVNAGRTTGGGGG